MYRGRRDGVARVGLGFLHHHPARPRCACERRRRRRHRGVVTGRTAECGSLHAVARGSALEDCNMAGEMATWGPQRSTDE